MRRSSGTSWRPSAAIACGGSVCVGVPSSVIRPERGRTMIVIDHDMDALFEIVERVTVLQEGRVLVEGTPDEIKKSTAVQEAYLGGVHGVLDA